MLSGASLELAHAVGPFSHAVGTGFGAGGFLVLPAPQSSPLGLRLDGALLSYGSTTSSFSDPNTSYAYAFRVTNNLAILGLGPQLSASVAGVRPYAFGVIGLGYFFTSSQVNDIYGNQGSLNLKESSNHVSFASGFGGGVRIPISTRSKIVSLDFGLEWRGHAKAKYLTENDLHADSTGVRFTSHEGRADLVVFRAGVTFEPKP